MRRLIRNFSLALLSAALLVVLYPNLIFPGFGLPWLAPIALAPLLIALAYEPRPVWRFALGEFAGIRGVGEAKLARYGEDFVAAVRGHAT